MTLRCLASCVRVYGGVELSQERHRPKKKAEGHQERPHEMRGRGSPNGWGGEKPSQRLPRRQATQAQTPEGQRGLGQHHFAILSVGVGE
jgi:hypothetical protein